MEKNKNEDQSLNKELNEEIIEFPQQDTFNEEDMSVVEEEGDPNVSNENK